MVLTQNKFLTFLLGEEIYGISVLKVKEIIGLMSITPVPRMPASIRGVINLRSKIIPVMDLRQKFGMGQNPYHDHTCIIITENRLASGNRLMGLVVDSVSEVVVILEDAIEPLVTSSDEKSWVLLSGIVKTQDKIILLVNTDRILNQE